MDLTTVTRTYENTCPPSSSLGTLHLKGGHAQVREGQLTIRPVIVSGDSSFGAEVSGVDWSRPVPEDIVQQLIKLQDTYAVLIFRKTGLDNERHIAFSRQLGKKLEINPFFYGRENDRVGEPLLWDVGNINIDGTLVQPSQRRWQHSLGNALWHTDSSYHHQRSKYSLLLSHPTTHVPDRPASKTYTHFSDTRHAYSSLPLSTKLLLEPLIVEHDLWHSRRLASPVTYSVPLPHELAAKPPAYHRLVQTAPDGRKTLYLAAHAKRIVGWGMKESQKLIWELIEWCAREEFVFSLEWGEEGGDMVWWDNRQSMHRANPYTTEMTARDVRRATVVDDGPLAFGVSEQEKREAGWKPEQAVTVDV
ncbi:uncharacterized protein BCR38DRAFT_478547 [Pseudomassariella vexata]|uniref:TauD/TfdA-like domain-containing protein n=1 Tax=Pseudomassariella vexata TaxID=1141098 RepID=A0A1Y2DCC2_9PEZI|nr:uncharacterized protein BCR38DRAFT_478547 [Pseudomassariella vexata]ORY56908.1 hypothetical protein BCR38DRAFT_478547 [Pseudomassariella vexata]